MQILNKMKFVVLFLAFIPLYILSLTFNFFTTPSKVFASHSRVNLLTTDNFAILAGSGITDVGTSVITGDVGLDPTGGASITGLTCAEITGTLYDNNGGYAGGGGGSTACRVTNAGLLTTAKNDLVTAYNDAAGRTTTSTVATNLGGTTLTDGTYDSASGTFEINGGGTLTLNGEGNADAVFIFKMATTLVTSSSSRVVLTNSAQACNVYWQVGSSATLGTATTLVGNVLALTTITDNGSSAVNGRLLARNGAVNTNNTTITKSTCAAGTAGATAETNLAATIAADKTSPLSFDLDRPADSCVIVNDSHPTFSFNVTTDAGSGMSLYRVYVDNQLWIDDIPADLPAGGMLSRDDVDKSIQYNLPFIRTWSKKNALTEGRHIWQVKAYDVSGNVRDSSERTLFYATSPSGVSDASCSTNNATPAATVTSAAPSLPNTGFAPRENSLPWYIPAGIFIGVLALLVLIQRKHKFSSRH